MIEDFRLWATKLGCPQECIPCDESLKSVFKSPQRDLFIDLMKRVQPRQDVKVVRENILISKLDRLKDLVPVCGRNFLPKEMQNYLKLEDLKKRKAELESKLDEHRREYESLATAIKRNNVTVIGLEHKHKLLDSKVTLLRFKLNALDADALREKSQHKRIAASMPVKFNAKTSSEKRANLAVERALEELCLFYQAHGHENAHQPKSVRDELWQKMRDIFANVPAYLIYNAIMRKKEEQLHNITTLKKPNADAWQTQSLSSVLTTGHVAKEPLTTFEMKVLKAKADLVTLTAKYIAARNEYKVLEERFGNAYMPFMCEVQNKVHLLDAQCNEEQAHQIISDFLVEYNTLNFAKAENEHLAQQIEQCKHNIEHNGAQLAKHEVLLGSIREVYTNINASINCIQYEMLQLGQIKDKIAYSKNLMKLLLDDVQASTAASNTKMQLQLHNMSAVKGTNMHTTTTIAGAHVYANKKLNLNSSMFSVAGIGNGNGAGVGAGAGIGIDSFELGGGDVFCSTKLDFDCTITSLKNTTLRGGGGGGAAGCSFTTLDATTLAITTNNAGNGIGGGILPPHLAELTAFAEAPLACFSCVTPQCAMYLAPNPFVVDIHELLSTMQLAPGILLTAHGALREVLVRSAAADLIAAHSSDFKLSNDLVNVDPPALKERMKRQREHIIELLDKIDITNVHTKHLLRKLEHLYHFLHDNQLRHYVPKSKCFNNQTYAEYNAEYTMYYRMATVGASFK